VTATPEAFVTDLQAWPSVGLPLAGTFTEAATVISEAFFRARVNDARWLVESVADDGETRTMMLLVAVTVADAVIPFAGDTLT
jgi:hypothetical protein